MQDSSVDSNTGTGTSVKLQVVELQILLKHTIANQSYDAKNFCGPDQKIHISKAEISSTESTYFSSTKHHNFYQTPFEYKVMMISKSHICLSCKILDFRVDLRSDNDIHECSIHVFQTSPFESIAHVFGSV